jgi:hypothetical protein
MAVALDESEALVNSHVAKSGKLLAKSFLGSIVWMLAYCAWIAQDLS